MEVKFPPQIQILALPAYCDIGHSGVAKLPTSAPCLSVSPAVKL